MEQIRKGLFETNSSSTHAIVISKEDNYEITYEDLYTSSWENYNFGFDRDTYKLLDNWDYKLAYVYIILLEISNDPKIVFPEVNLQKFKDRVNSLYNQINNNSITTSVIPDHIFQVLEFIHKKDLGIIDRKTIPNFDFDTSLFDDILRHTFCAYVDHDEYFMIHEGDTRRNSKPCALFLEKLQTDDDYLKKFLFSPNSYITIGGDEYRGYNIKTLGFEYDYEKESDWEDRVNEYKKTHEIYFKGN
jgi:hypothetical protein